MSARAVLQVQHADNDVHKGKGTGNRIFKETEIVEPIRQHGRRHPGRSRLSLHSLRCLYLTRLPLQLDNTHHFDLSSSIRFSASDGCIQPVSTFLRL